MASSESEKTRLELMEGDLLHRRRLVEDILDEGHEFRKTPSDSWGYGYLDVDWSHDNEYLIARDPDGDSYQVGVPSDMEDPERIEAVQQELDHVALHWTDDL